MGLYIFFPHLSLAELANPHSYLRRPLAHRRRLRDRLWRHARPHLEIRPLQRALVATPHHTLLAKGVARWSGAGRKSGRKESDAILACTREAVRRGFCTGAAIDGFAGFLVWMDGGFAAWKGGRKGGREEKKEGGYLVRQIYHILSLHVKSRYVMLFSSLLLFFFSSSLLFSPPLTISSVVVCPPNPPNTSNPPNLESTECSHSHNTYPDLVNAWRYYHC